jgi:hypothetical protein
VSATARSGRAEEIVGSGGYRVDGPIGRIGYVHEVRVGQDGSPSCLAIRVAPVRRQVVIVPANDVACVAPRSRWIWLRRFAPLAVETAS